MLKIMHNDEEFSTYSVSKVDVTMKNNKSDQLDVTIHTNSEIIAFYIWSDTHNTAKKCADRISKCVSRDIAIGIYSERSYLYIIDESLDENVTEYQLKISGRIIT